MPAEVEGVRFVRPHGGGNGGAARDGEDGGAETPEERHAAWSTRRAWPRAARPGGRAPWPLLRRLHAILARPVSSSDSSSSSVFTVPLAATTPSTTWTTNGVPGTFQRRERRRVLLLLDHEHGQTLPGERGDGRRSAGGRAGRSAEKKKTTSAPRPRRPSSSGAGAAELRPFLGELERDPRADPHA